MELAAVGSTAAMHSASPSSFDSLSDRSWLVHWDGRESQRTLLAPLNATTWVSFADIVSPTGFQTTINTLASLDNAYIVGENAVFNRGSGGVTYEILTVGSSSIGLATPDLGSGSGGTFTPEHQPCTELICGGSLAPILLPNAVGSRQRIRPAAQGGGLNCLNNGGAYAGSLAFGANLPAGLTQLYFASIFEMRTTYNSSSVIGLMGIFAGTGLRRMEINLGRENVGGSTISSRVQAAVSLNSTWGSAESTTALTLGTVNIVEVLVSGGSLSAWINGVPMTTTANPTTDISTYSSLACKWSLGGNMAIGGSFSQADSTKGNAYLLGLYASLNDYSADAELHGALEAQFPGLLFA